MENETERTIPDFAIFRNSRTRQSAIWTKAGGRWHECQREEYPAIEVLVHLIEKSPNPVETAEEIIKFINMQG